VIPPVTDIRELHTTYDNLLDLKSHIDRENTFSRINQVRNEDPETTLEVLEVTIHASDDFDKTVNFYWVILAYGPHGNHVDVQKQAVRENIRVLDLASIEAWKTFRAPELFRDIGFTLYPGWKNIAIPDIGSVEGMYSPTIVNKTFIESIHTDLSLPIEYIQDKIEMTVFDYKSICVAFIPDATNDADHQTVSKIFVDYILTPTSNEMLQRVSVITRRWIREMIDLIAVAEGKYEIEDVNADIRAIVLNDVSYYTTTFEGINYRIYPRSQQVG
jgi:hypothetical protein